MSNKIQEGGRRVTVDLASDCIKILDNARVRKGRIMSITSALEEIIRKVDIKMLWSEK